jgi:hypothetical protein
MRCNAPQLVEPRIVDVAQVNVKWRQLQPEILLEAPECRPAASRRWFVRHAHIPSDEESPSQRGVGHQNLDRAEGRQQT